MIIHNNKDIWYITDDAKRSTTFSSYEEMQRSLIAYNLPSLDNLREIKSSRTHKRYVKM